MNQNNQKPIVINQDNIEDFRSKNHILNDLDIVDIQTRELTKINQQSFSVNFIYYPWSKTLLKCVDGDSLFALRTNRNRELITTDEQSILANAVIGVAGMSVGSGIALSMAYSGISKTIKIADHDALDTSNLNRLRESLLNIGVSKAELSARHLYELDPYLDVHNYDQGVNSSNIDDFFGSPKLNLVVDEIDDFKMKVQLRLHAKKYHVPLIMFTSLGDHILVDIERYDLDADQKLFNGLLSPEQEIAIMNQEITQEDEKNYAVSLVGAEYIPTRALRSVAKIGTELVGRPQLYSTVAVDGGLSSYIIRKILLGSNVGGRYFIKFSDLFNLESDDLANSQDRENVLKQLLGAQNDRS